jgi:hypothetical protein
MLGNVKIQTRLFRESMGTGKLSAILKFVGQVMMKRCEVQVALESSTTKSKIENHSFSQVIFHLPKKGSTKCRPIEFVPSVIVDGLLNSLTAIGSHDRQYFNELRARVVSPRIFVRSQSLIAR